MAIPRRISSSELYDNRNIIKQIEDLCDDVGEAGIENISFTRAVQHVTLDVETVSGEHKTASFEDRSVTSVGATQSGTVVTLTFNMSDGTHYDANFNASGTGTTITQGNGITVTGTSVSGYTIKIDESYVATTSSVDALGARIDAVEDEIGPETTAGTVRADIAAANANITANTTAISTLDAAAVKITGDQTVAGTKKIGRIQTQNVFVYSKFVTTAKKTVMEFNASSTTINIIIQFCDAAVQGICTSVMKISDRDVTNAATMASTVGSVEADKIGFYVDTTNNKGYIWVNGEATIMSIVMRHGGNHDYRYTHILDAGEQTDISDTTAYPNQKSFAVS